MERGRRNSGTKKTSLSAEYSGGEERGGFFFLLIRFFPGFGARRGDPFYATWEYGKRFFGREKNGIAKRMALVRALVLWATESECRPA